MFEVGTSIEIKYKMVLIELDKIYKENQALKDKLDYAKEWLIDIAEFRENRSDFERYMKSEFGYVRK